MTTLTTLDDELGCPSGLEPAHQGGTADPAPFVRRKDGVSTLELLVFGAKCAGCISKIEGGLNSVPGVDSARLNLSTGKLAVTWHDKAVDPRAIVSKVTSLGYRAAPFDPASAAGDKDVEGRALLRALAVAGFAAANIMLLSVAVWAGVNGEMGPATRELMHYISSAIAIPAAAYAGRPFFRSAFGALKNGHANMDVPISLAVILALGLSIYETIHGGVEAYFDAAVMLLFFLLIGRYLDHRLRAKARAAARDLLALQATTATRLGAGGELQSISTRDIHPGDTLILSPGDRAPADGEVIEGRSNVDLSLVTGESAPAVIESGNKLHAGVLNLSSRLVMRATKTADDSLIADLTRLIEAGEQSKSRYRRLADKAASLYVPIVHTLAAATFLVWFFILDAGVRVSMMNAIAVLIITCPCALGLAAPAVQVVATGRLFRAGVLVKSGDALERLSEVDTMIFDKTGTLTYGRQRVSNLGDIPWSALEGAASLARISRHPLSRAIVASAGPGKGAPGAVEHQGFGIEGEVDGVKARLGRADWVGASTASGDATEVWYVRGDEPPVRFTFDDELRPDARETIDTLKARGLSVTMLSGDQEAPAQKIAAALGGVEYRARLTPQEKIGDLQKLSAAGAKAAMVGDGLNDAPSLAAAHASLSPGTAADASQAAADFVYQGEKLAPIVEAFDVSRLARRRMLENFAFAAVYNLFAAPLAAFGFVTPLIAALAMSSSSIIVTLNALRLAKTQPRKR
ncbi:MAG TPA: heavy metal translocating P-type ATPase [Parvularculaceae bacterium]|nr:heavy metal translocating P-type ATPase [Parvularculaceae bacterium]